MLDTLLENPTSQEAPRQSFSDYKLPGFLQEGLRRLNFQYATDIQAEAIPVLLSGQDLIAQSQTGSGKTAAFGIPLLARIQRQSRDLQAVVLVPTRELAIQVTQVFKALAGPAIRITPVYGGTSMEGQIRGMQRGGYQVVIATPGRLRDHLNRGTVRLDTVRMLILDEADEMLDRGFAQDVEAIIAAATGQRQTALFSATLPEWVNQTAHKHLRPEHAKITLAVSPDSHPDITHLVYDMNLDDKPVALRHLLDTHTNQPILVFARTKHGVKKLAARLESEGYPVAGLQGNLSQPAREQVMAAFRAGRVRILVATNVGARGLDVNGVGHVINYDLPESVELFTHRVGRTGRNGASGTAITFLNSTDRPKWREIERAMLDRGIDFERQRWDGPRATQSAEGTTQPQRPARRFERTETAPQVHFEERRNFARPRSTEQERDFRPVRREERDFRSTQRTDRPVRRNWDENGEEIATPRFNRATRTDSRQFSRDNESDFRPARRPNRFDSNSRPGQGKSGPRRSGSRSFQD